MSKPVRLVDEPRDELLAESAKYGMGFIRAVRSVQADRPVPRGMGRVSQTARCSAIRDEAVPVRDRLSRAGKGDPCACRRRDQATTRLLAPSWLIRSRRRLHTPREDPEEHGHGPLILDDARELGLVLAVRTEKVVGGPTVKTFGAKIACLVEQPERGAAIGRSRSTLSTHSLSATGCFRDQVPKS